MLNGDLFCSISQYIYMHLVFLYTLYEVCLLLVVDGTLTSDVSLWQFLQALDSEEKVRSAWSNFPPWKLRKNVVKGS